MDNLKHTPAPWLVMGNQRNGHFDFVLPMAKDEDFQANARLIAAAPELLEVLKSIIEIGKRDMSNPKYNGYFESAKQVIAKAEGKEL